jgi:hypothetical protein
MKRLLSLSLLSTFLGFSAACSTEANFEVTFYGYPDNSPPGPGTAHNCGGRNYIAGGGQNVTRMRKLTIANGSYLGTGTYSDPVYIS